MKLTTAIATLSLIATAAPALAEVTAAQRAACTPDVWRLCSSEIPNIDGIKACLRRERASLSAGCRTVMDTVDRGVQTVSGKTSAVARN